MTGHTPWSEIKHKKDMTADRSPARPENVIRAAFDLVNWDPNGDLRQAEAALDSLEERLAEAERERDDARANAILQAHEASQQMWREQKDRADFVEARLRLTEEALRRITHQLENMADPYNEKLYVVKKWAEESLVIAREALAASPGRVDG